MTDIKFPSVSYPGTSHPLPDLSALNFKERGLIDLSQVAPKVPSEVPASKKEVRESKPKPKKTMVSYPQGDAIVAKLKDNGKRQNELKEAINRLKKEYDFEELKSSEEEFRTELYNFMIANNLKSYKGFKLTTCQPKEITAEANHLKRIKNIKDKIDEVAPELEDEVKENIAEELA